ncbi:hypothetical protein U1Q18_042150 [Sarracenia purpurea var. burkii]
MKGFLTGSPPQRIYLNARRSVLGGCWSEVRTLRDRRSEVFGRRSERLEVGVQGRDRRCVDLARSDPWSGSRICAGRWTSGRDYEWFGTHTGLSSWAWMVCAGQSEGSWLFAGALLNTAVDKTMLIRIIGDSVTGFAMPTNTPTR